MVDELPQGPKGWGFAKQILRSGTSIGANIHEADGALTEREFAHSCNIARKEACETEYWLRLIKDGRILSTERIEPLILEASKLTKILATIVRKTQSHALSVSNA